MLILASASPRRARILSSICPEFTIAPQETAEVSIPDNPRETVLSNAAEKFRAAREKFPHDAIIAADTIVWFENAIVGKPRSLEQAADFLRSFSGKTQTVFTGLALARAAEKSPRLILETSEVTFKVLSEKTIREYLRATNPLDRAGAYDIEEHADIFIADCRGSRTNVSGLPRETIAAWLGGK